MFREAGTGRELMLTVTNLPGQSYPCADPGGVPVGQEGADLGCDWPVAYTLDVPLGWPSGIYLADLIDDDDDAPGGYGAYIFFVVKEPQPGSGADILCHVPTATWQAYNIGFASIVAKFHLSTRRTTNGVVPLSVELRRRSVARNLRRLTDRMNVLCS